MKTSLLKTVTLKRVLSSALFASIAISGTVQAEQWDDALYNIIHPESADIFNVGDYKKSSTQEGIFSLNDDHNKDAVWSYEFEQYVDSADFERPALASTDDVNHYMGSNPTAAGSTHQVFFYNETAGEYHLQ